MGGLRTWLLLAALVALGGCSGPIPYGATCVSVPASWNQDEGGLIEWDAGRDKIFIDKTGIYWNALPISAATLHDYLEQAGNRDLQTPIILQIQPDAECGVVREAIAEMKRAPVCEKHCGTLKRWPRAEPPLPPGE